VGRRERENGNVIEGVNLFKVHCIYVWNDYNEMPSYYQCLIIQNYNNIF
jgi:hypothetical protein